MDVSVRWMIFAGAIGFCVAYALWGPAGAPAVLAAPKIVQQPTQTVKSSALRFEPAALDFGEVRVGDVKSQVVKIHNPTAQPITIDDIRGTCGCISLELKQKTIPANSAADLAVHYTGLAGTPKKEYGITAVTTEFRDAKVHLPVQAHTTTIFNLEPAVLFFDLKPEDSEKTLTARVTRNDGKPFTVRGVNARNRNLIASVKAVDNGAAFEVTCTVKAGQISAGVETVAIITDHPTHPVVELKASIRGTSAVASLLPVLVGQWKDGRSKLTFSAPIQRQTPGTLEISEVKENTGLELKTELVRRSASVIQVDITIPDPSVFEKNRRDGEFIIQTNVLPEPMRLPFTVPPPPATQ